MTAVKNNNNKKKQKKKTNKQTKKPAHTYVTITINNVFCHRII